MKVPIKVIKHNDSIYGQEYVASIEVKAVIAIPYELRHNKDIEIQAIRKVSEKCYKDFKNLRTGELHELYQFLKYELLFSPDQQSKIDNIFNSILDNYDNGYEIGKIIYE